MSNDRHDSLMNDFRNQYGNRPPYKTKEQQKKWVETDLTQEEIKHRINYIQVMMPSVSSKEIMQ